MLNDATSEMHYQYVDACAHKEKIAFLQHRAALNQQVLELTLFMAEVNAKAIENNRRVMETNEDIVAFNHKLIAENSHWLQGGLSAREADPRAPHAPRERR